MVDNSHEAHIRSARDTVRNSSALLQLQFLRVADQLLSDILAADQKELREVKQELALRDGSRLHLHNRRGKQNFASYDPLTQKEIGITNDMDKVHQLARQTYLIHRKKTLEVSCRKMERLIGAARDGSEELLRSDLDKYRSAGIDLNRILFTKEQNEWIDEPYSPNPFHPEHLIYPTKGNVMMRSKSEASLGNISEDLGLPYRYDDLVKIHTDPKSGSLFHDTYFADFKFPNLAGGITIHEHLGALHLDQYSDNSLKRLNDYHEGTICELPNRPVRHGEITWSFEHDLRSDNLIQVLLKKILLPIDL